MAAVSVIGALLLLSQAALHPLDDPDPALQRPGFLDFGALPETAPPVAGVRYSGGKTVVFFERAGRVGKLCRALSTHRLGPSVRAVVVVPKPPAPASCSGTVLVDAGLASSFGMRVPREGGPPVGYAIVDHEGMIRYRTLDPAVASLLSEVETVVEALP